MTQQSQDGDRSRSAAAVIFMCGPLRGLSGGDMHALRLLEAWGRSGQGSALLVAPETMRSHLMPGTESSLVVVRTPLDRMMRNLATYAVVVVLRTLRSCVGTCPPARVAVASSHFFHDVIPCAVHRRRYRSQPAAYVYHLVADMDRGLSLRSLASAAAERLSIALLRRIRAIVFVDNDETRQSLVARGFPPDRIIDTRNAYDPPSSLPPRRAPGSPHVAFCGRFVAEKGIWDMLELSRALADVVPEARVTMLGDGPLRERFLSALEESGLRNVEAPGFVPESEKWRLLRSASLFAAPSREEGWGIAVGEALIAGLPPVVYDLPAYAHFGDLPIRVPVADSRRFIESVVTLLRESDRLGAERQRVERGSARLPRWDEVLEYEISALSEAGAPT